MSKRGYHVLLTIRVFHRVKDIQSFFSPQSFLPLLVPKPRHHIFPRFEICARIWWANDKIIYSKNNVIFFYKLSVSIIFIPFLLFMIPHFLSSLPILLPFLYLLPHSLFWGSHIPPVKK